MAEEGSSMVQGEDLLLSQSIASGNNKKEIEEVIISSPEKPPVKYQVRIVQRNGIDTQVWVCGLCNREFRYQYALFRHFPVHKESQTYQCDVCSKNFRHLATLQQHQAIHSKDRPFGCSECQKSFNRLSTLISHQRTHAPEKPYKCPVCQHGFHQKGNLRNHVYIHTNERPYKCPHCDKGFNQMSNLACHKMKAHAQEAEVSVHCKICDMRFAKKSLLKAHNQEHHKEIAKGRGSSKSASKTGPRSSTMSKFPYEKSIVIPLVDTDAMRKVRAKGETPFGLLTKTNMSVLVRIHDFGDKSAICEATKVDLGAVEKIPIVAIIEEKEEGGEYLVKMPSKQFTHEMNIKDGKIFFVKKEAEEGKKNAFFGIEEVKEEEEEGQEVFGGENLGNNSFNSLLEVIKNEGFSPDVPNILKFFADAPQSLQTSQWEKIDKDCQEESQEFHQL